MFLNTKVPPLYGGSCPQPTSPTILSQRAMRGPVEALGVMHGLAGGALPPLQHPTLSQGQRASEGQGYCDRGSGETFSEDPRPPRSP